MCQCLSLAPLSPLTLVFFLQMCDFIHKQNIKSLIEYIVTKHLSLSSPSSVIDRPSLEEVATPYVQTLTILRRTYEDDLRHAKSQVADEGGTAQSNGAYFDNSTVPRAAMSEKALEDQVRFESPQCIMLNHFANRSRRSANFERSMKRNRTLRATTTTRD